MKRINYLDRVKVFAIFLVCLYHFSWGPGLNDYTTITSIGSFIQKILSSLSLIGVPLFFMANGAILLNRNLDVLKHYKVLFKIIISFVSYRVLTISVISVYQGINIYHGSKVQLLNYLLLENPMGIELQHLWFMRYLIALYVLFPVIHIFYTKMSESKLLINYAIRVMISSLFLINIQRISNLFCYLIPIFNNLNFTNLQSLLPINSLFLVVVFYFILGGFLHRKYYIELSAQNVSHELFILVIALVVINITWFYSSYFNNNYDIVFSNYTTIMGVISAFQCYKIFIYYGNLRGQSTKIDKVISVVSNSTLQIYYLHWIIGYTFLASLRTHFPVSTNSTYLFALNVLKSMALVILITLSVNLIKHLREIAKKSIK